jgi:hypothetical protein
MFNRKDPIADSVKVVMEQNAIRRAVEKQVNESFGVTAKRGLPHEMHASYDDALEKATKIALSEGVEALDELSQEKLRGYQASLHKKSMFGFGKSPMEKAQAKGDLGYHRDTVKRSKGNELAAKKLSPISTGIKMRATRALEEEETIQEGGLASLGKKIATQTYKNKKFVAAQNMPGKDANQHAERVKKVKELAKEETEAPSPIKESFERFLRNKFLKD